jgi:lipoprotein-anchoring transpeptidase ErfK/SrfK
LSVPAPTIAGDDADPTWLAEPVATVEATAESTAAPASAPAAKLTTVSAAATTAVAAEVAAVPVVDLRDRLATEAGPTPTWAAVEASPTADSAAPASATPASLDETPLDETADAPTIATPSTSTAPCEADLSGAAADDIAVPAGVDPAEADVVVTVDYDAAAEPVIPADPPEVNLTVAEATSEGVAETEVADVPVAVADTAVLLAPVSGSPGGPVGPPASPRRSREPQTGRARPRRTGLIVLSSLALVLVAGLVGSGVFASYYYGDRAKPGVALAGTSVAGQTAAQLQSTVGTLRSSLRLTLTLGQQSLEATATDLGVTIDTDQSVNAALTATTGDRLWNAYNPFVTKDTPLTWTVDENHLQTYLDDHFIKAADVVVDAVAAYDQGAGRFAITPGRDGLTVDIAPVLEAVERYAAGDAEFQPVALDTVTDPPRITDAVAQAAVDKANAGLDLALVLDNGMTGYGRRTYQVDRGSIVGWTLFKSDAAAGEISVVYDRERIAAELPPLLTEGLAVPMQPQVTLVEPSGAFIAVSELGVDGTKVTDPAPALSAVETALTEGRSAEISVPVEVEPYQEIETQPPSNYNEPNGAKWIDVNKSTYRVTLYEGTTAINSFLVSIGRPGPYETTDGTYYIYLRYDFQIMRGTPPDTYETPTNWVSYFNESIAFHSAPWNEPNNWGRRVSHGCVNMRTAEARILFDWAPLGTKVEVHY